MKDVVKTSKPYVNAEGKLVVRRRRRKNYSLYYLLTFLFVAAVMFVLSRTLLFNIEEFTVEGDDIYSAKELAEAAGIEEGDNMFSLSLAKLEDKIRTELTYVESVSIKRKLPDTLCFEITKANAVMCAEYSGQYAVLSSKGKVLESRLTSPISGIPAVTGLELSEVKDGENAESLDNSKLGIALNLANCISDIGFENIGLIDISDRANIKLSYDGRIEIDFGTSLDYEYKLKYIKELVTVNLNRLSEGKVIYHSQTAGASFIKSEDLENSDDTQSDEDTGSENTEDGGDTQEDNQTEEESQ